MINSKRIYLVNLLMDFLPSSGLQTIKAKLYRWAGVKVGKNVEFFQGVKIQGIGEIEIGDGAFIGHEVLLMVNDGSKIILEEEAIISSRTTVVTGFHPITPSGKRIVSREGTTSTIRICRGVGISVNCVILAGVTVGEMSLVGAGSVLTKNVEPYTLVGGCPAKFIKKLS